MTGESKWDHTMGNTDLLKIFKVTSGQFAHGRNFAAKRAYHITAESRDKIIPNHLSSPLSKKNEQIITVG